MKEIDLEEIYISIDIEFCRSVGVAYQESNRPKKDDVSWAIIRNAMKEACKKAIELCSENAITKEDCVYNEVWMENEFKTIADKQSILNTINQIK